MTSSVASVAAAAASGRGSSGGGGKRGGRLPSVRCCPTPGPVLAGVPTVAAVSSSCLGCMLLLLGVCTSSWDSVTFDLLLVNRSMATGAARRLLYADSERTQLAGIIILPTSNSSTSSGSSISSSTAASAGGYCLLNVYASLWSLCDSVNRADPINQDYSTYCLKYSLLIRNLTCFNYITNYNDVRDQLDNTENTSESQIMKMQNNAMACCIVVLLCVAASITTGMIGVLARVVPAIMVTGVLHLTAGIFIIFSNSIEHEKASRMTRKPQIDVCPQCTCYSLVKTPEQFCNSAYRTVTIGWSVGITWMAAATYLIASASWIALTRRLRIEKSKTMM